MLALKRAFIWEAGSEGTRSLEQDLLDRLVDALAQQMGVDSELVGWPDGEWQGVNVVTKASRWQTDTGESSLLDLTCEVRRSTYTWRLELALGQTSQGALVLYEKWRIEMPGRAVPYDDLPPITRFVTERKRRPSNLDGLDAIGPLWLQPKRLAAFVEFLGSPTRQLPIIVMSPRNGKESELAKEISGHVYGLAHVLYFKAGAEKRIESALRQHPCYGGAVRLYMPGYQASDPSWQHPFWTVNVDLDDVYRELVYRVARESVLLDDHPQIVALRRERDETVRRRSDQLQKERLHELQQRLNVEHDLGEWRVLAEDATREADALRQSLEDLSAERDRLAQELQQAHSKIEGLQWHLNQRWQAGEEPTPTTPQPRLLLSRRAQQSYCSWDDLEQAYWRKHVFPKLLDAELRNSQREPVKSKGRDCFVYPRGRSADGRRVIYYQSNSDVFVCELFATAAHDDDYNALREQGVDTADYRQEEFEALEDIVC